MLNSVCWVNKSIDSFGNVCQGIRKDRLCSLNFIDIEYDCSIVLPCEYIYDIFYYDHNCNFTNKISIRRCHSKSIFLFKHEKIRIFIAHSNDIEIEKMRKLRCVKHNSYYFDIKECRKIKFIGDSIIQGVGGSGYSPNGMLYCNSLEEQTLWRMENTKGICYTNFLKHKLKDEFDINVINRGCAKYTSSLLSYAIRDLIHHDDEYVLVAIGTNDRLLKNDNMDNFIQRILSIVSYIEALGKKVILQSPIPSSTEIINSNCCYSLYQISDSLKKLSSRLGIPYIDMYTAILCIVSLEKISLSDILTDGLHPNDLGYYLMYKCFCNYCGIVEKEYDISSLNKISICTNTLLFTKHLSDFNVLKFTSYDKSLNTVITNYIKTNIGYLFLSDCYLEFNQETISNAPIITLNKNNFDEKIIAQTSIYDYYKFKANCYFSTIIYSDSFCDFLKPGLLDSKGNRITEDVFIEDVRNGRFMCPSQQLIELSSDMFKDNENLTRSSILWKYSLFWISNLLSQYFLCRNKEILCKIECQLGYFTDWLGSDFSKTDFMHIPSADHSAAVRTVVFCNYLKVKEEKNNILENKIKVILFQHIDWMIEQSLIVKNNHGLIMLQGLLSVLQIIEKNELFYKLCTHIENEIKSIWTENFSLDYVCKENSIGYFNFNLKCFIEMLNCIKKSNFPIDCTTIESNIEKANDVLKQLIFQNCRIPPIGDSDIVKINNNSVNANVWYKQSNIVCLKNDDRYFYMHCGFDSPAHKHVDDSSYILRYKGIDIITDAGKYNYDRTSEIRKYVESCLGHAFCFPNSLIDVLSPNYVKEKFNCGKITSHDEINGYFITECYYLLNNGFKNSRKICQYDNNLFISDEYENPLKEDIYDRIILSPDAVLIKKDRQKYVFKNKYIFFSIDILTNTNGMEITLEKGYVSFQDFGYQRNQVLQIYQKGKSKSKIEYVVHYWDVRDYDLLVDKTYQDLVGIEEIDIWGSCVSRDVFGNNKNIVKHYVARQSIISSLCPQITEFKDSIFNESNFKLSMVLSDLNKNTYQQLKINHSKYIILDFIDERFSLLKINSSYATMSNEFISSVPQTAKNYKIVNREYINDILTVEGIPVENYIREFSTKIKEIYGDRIILHKIFLSDVYIKDNLFYLFDKQILEENTRINKILSEYYYLIEKYIPNIFIVSSFGYPADANHKWGIGPMHFVDEYYFNISKQIQKIVKHQF